LSTGRFAVAPNCEATSAVNWRSRYVGNLNLDALTDEEVIALWFHANADLHRRGAKFWHAGDLAEILVAAAVGGVRARSNVERGHDVVGPDGARWQVKVLVNRPGNTRTSVGFLTPDAFDHLAIVRFAQDMNAVEAWCVPPHVVPEYARWYDDRAKYRLTFTKKLVNDPASSL
jgi:hypothetical protein